MQDRSRRLDSISTAVAVVGLALALPAGGCGESPTNPSPPITAPQVPAPPPPVVLNLDIEGPDIVNLGETVQFRLVLRSSEGTERDVTSEGTWTPGWGDFVTITTPGRVRGAERGDTYVNARFEDRHASKLVTVLPAGTHKLRGHVVEQPGPTGPVAGAIVDVTKGTGRGLYAYTDNYGWFVLYGVAGETSLRVAKTGYGTVTRTLTVEADSEPVEFELALTAPRRDVSGTYTLTLTAAESCAAILPKDALVRTYTAVVGQAGPTLGVRLSGATLLPYFDGFSGRIEPDRIVFDLTWYDGEGPVVVEQIPWVGLFVPDGQAVVDGSPDRLAGSMFGPIRVFTSGSYSGSPSAWCSANDHQFVMTRQ
jgi:hypothetical protein